MRSFTESLGTPFAIGAARTDIIADPGPWAERFREEHAIVCHDVFDPPLFRRLFAAAERTPFRADHIKGVGTREVEHPQRIGGTLALLLQRANLFRWLEQVTSRTGIAGFEGQLHQARAGSGDALDWHDDLHEPQRVLGVTIGFSDAAYAGGRFELRRVDDPADSRSFEHAEPGTMLIFALGPDLEHRLLPVSSGGPRRVFAGGFTRAPILPPLIG